MKLTILSTTTVIILALTGNSYAAEHVDWSGFYAGGGIGELFTQSKIIYRHERIQGCSNNNYGSDGGGACGGNQNLATTFSDNIAKGLGNIHGGYNWSLDNSLVIGVEPSFSFYQYNKSHHMIVSNAFGDYLNIQTKENYTVSLQGTVGVPVDNYLFYIGGGPTMANISTTVTQANVNGSTPFPRTFSRTDIRVGAVVTGGVKYHWDANWIIGGELSMAGGTNGTAATAGEYIPGAGGLTLPNTQLVTKSISETALLKLSYQF